MANPIDQRNLESLSLDLVRDYSKLGWRSGTAELGLEKPFAESDWDVQGKERDRYLDFEGVVDAVKGVSYILGTVEIPDLSRSEVRARLQALDRIGLDLEHLSSLLASTFDSLGKPSSHQSSRLQGKVVKLHQDSADLLDEIQLNARQLRNELLIQLGQVKVFQLGNEEVLTRGTGTIFDHQEEAFAIEVSLSESGNVSLKGFPESENRGLLGANNSVYFSQMHCTVKFKSIGDGRISSWSEPGDTRGMDSVAMWMDGDSASDLRMHRPEKTTVYTFKGQTGPPIFIRVQANGSVHQLKGRFAIKDIEKTRTKGRFTQTIHLNKVTAMSDKVRIVTTLSNDQVSFSIRALHSDGAST